MINDVDDDDNNRACNSNHLAKSRFGFFSNPSTPRLQSQKQQELQNPVSVPNLRCKTTLPATIDSTASAPESLRLHVKSAKNSPKSPSSFSLLKSSLRLSKNRCGICLQSVKTWQGTAIFTGMMNSDEDVKRVTHMGNSFGCSASGERLVSAARDGDLIEAKMLLECNPCLAKYSTFGGLNSPLHFGAAKAHNEIVALLLEKGADVNSRNYCGQTALMQACRYGHWEVVQTLLLYRCNVTRADYLSGRTALHFAAVNGNVRCIRLLVADFGPSTACETKSLPESDRSDDTVSKNKNNHSALSKFVNKAADGGITALHMAALNGYFDCVQLLLDIHAKISAATFHYGTTMDMIGAGSTPLHYAACGGSLKCCQILLSRNASRLSLNCNGWLPLDVARMWGRHWLEPWLNPNSNPTIPIFPPSKHLSLPLLSVLNIARDFGMQSSTAASDETDICAVCLERACTVAAEGCGHALCVRCALYLCSTSNIPSETVGPPGAIPCPLCRHGIVSFVRLPDSSTAKEIKLNISLGLCTPCMLHPRDQDHPSSPTRTPEIRKKRVASVSADLFCPVTCSPFSSVALPLCSCSEDGPCTSFEPPEDNETHSDDRSVENDKVEGPRLGRTTCSSMFWGRRSCSREHQCNSEINV